MLSHVRAALVSLIVLTVVTGIIYPLIVTGIAQAVFPFQANGSLIVKDGKVVGSALIGQPFDDPRYFWGRPSATSPFADNAASSKRRSAMRVPRSLMIAGSDGLHPSTHRIRGTAGR